VETDTQQTVGNLLDTAEQISAVINEVENVMAELSDIVDAVSDASDGIEEVADAAEDQATSTEEIASMIDDSGCCNGLPDRPPAVWRSNRQWLTANTRNRRRGRQYH